MIDSLGSAGALSKDEPGNPVGKTRGVSPNREAVAAPVAPPKAFVPLETLGPTGVSSHRLLFLPTTASVAVVELGPTTGVASHLFLRGGSAPVELVVVVEEEEEADGCWMTGVASQRLTPAVVGAPLAVELMTGVASHRARLVRTGAAAPPAAVELSVAVVLPGAVEVVEEEEEEEEEDEAALSLSFSAASLS